MNKPLLLMLGLSVAVTAQASPDRNVIPLPAAKPATLGAPAPAAAPAWSQLSEAQRRQRRADHAAWRALSEAERDRVRQAAARFAALPPAQQQSLREQFAAQDQSFRDGWRLGPLLGEYYSRLQGLFGFLPVEQREPTLALLRQLSRTQVAQLALVAQRTPPTQRDAVRTAFLAVPAAQRDAWLKQQVGE